MRKIRALITGLLLVFSLSSCEQGFNTPLKSNNSLSTSNDIDGGPHSRVAGCYEFKSFDDYIVFYDIFKNYNEERYWVPKSSSNFDITYTFKSEGMYLDDVNAKRYDLDFKYQTMMVDINDSDFSLKIDLCDIQGRELLFNGLSFSYRQELNASSLNIPIQLLCGDFVIGNGLYLSKAIGGQVNTEKLNDILALMEGGYDYVF